jgi:hypothetical protein
MTKIDAARAIFARYYVTASRKKMIELMVLEGLTPAGASTYYQKLKKEQDPANVASAPPKHLSKLPSHISVIKEITQWKGYGDEINHVYFLRDSSMIAYSLFDGTIHNTVKPMRFDKRGRTFENLKNHNYALDEDSNITIMKPQ